MVANAGAAGRIRILIAALGGEGGGVLTSWLQRAAIASGHLVHSTYIPGVAQRTGATTYYLEMVANAGGRAPDERLVLALTAAPGEVDVVVASELLEAVRAIEAGFVTPDRTLLIASSSRTFTIEEKGAMGDGRLDAERMRDLVGRFARTALVADFGGIAARANAPLNAVLLGAIAGTGALPIASATLRAAIGEEGKAVAANLGGFAAGLAATEGARAAPQARVAAAADAVLAPRYRPQEFPPEARAVLSEAIRRLVDYQDRAYADAYLARVRARAGRPGADGAFVGELARQLALRMCAEDVIRVAELKLRAARLQRVRSEAGAGAGDIVDISEYMRPGVEELCGLLPPAFGRWVLRHVRGDRSWAMRLRSTRFSGFVRLRLLAGLRRWRRRTLRFAEEEAWVRHWLELVDRTLAVCPEAAREVVATAALVRGYADTYRRGLANWHRIMAEVVEPMLAGALPRAQFAEAVLQARIAASKDPAGTALRATLAAIGRLAADGPRAVGARSGGATAPAVD